MEILSILKEKTLRTLICILAMLFVSVSTADSLKWTFDGDVRLVGLDSSQKAEIEKKGVLFQEGLEGSCIRFQGRGFVKTRMEESTSGNITITALVKIESKAQGIGNYIISACHNTQDNTLLYGLRTIDNKAQFVFRYKDNDKYGYISVESPTPLPLKEWVYITAVKDSNRIALYLNGAKSATKNTTHHILPYDTIYIGQENSGSRIERGLIGSVNKLEVAEYAKSENELFSEYTELTKNLLEVKKIGENYYFIFDVPEKDSRFPDAPTRLNLDINYLQSLIESDVKLNPETITVKKWDTEDNKPIDYDVKFRTQYELYTAKAIVGWLRDEQVEMKYAVGISSYSSLSKPVIPQDIPLVGIGEAVSVGNTELFADLGQGVAGYPSVVDWNGNGRLDLLVSFVIPRKIFLFENIGTDKDSQPILKAPVMVWQGHSRLTFDIIQEPCGDIYAFSVSRANPGRSWENVEEEYMTIWQTKDIEISGERKLEHVRSLKIYGLPRKHSVFDIKLQDINGNGAKDLVMGVQEGVWWWTEDGINPWNKGLGNPQMGYGKGYDSTNKWVGVPPMGSVYIAYNEGTSAEPQFAKAQLLTAGGEPIKMPTTQISPCFIDLNGNGKLDLLLGTGVDRILAYYNTAENPNEIELAFPVNALRDTAVSKWSYFDCRFEVVDWDSDGRLDVLISSNPGLVVKCKIEDGKLVEEQILKCKGGNVWAETLVVPTVIDFNNNGKWDIITGDSSGFLSFFENTGTNTQPLFASREKLKAGGCEFRPVAGYSGSIQGPSEARWGYLAPEVYDWNGNGILDFIISDITGYVYWLSNVAQEKGKYKLTNPIPLEIDTWPLKVRWRTRPVAWPAEPLPHLVMTDNEGYLALYRRDSVQGESNLKQPERLLFDDGSEIKLDGPGGYNGRGKFYRVDWNRDGVWDIITGQPARAGINRNIVDIDMPREPRATVSVLINIGTNENPVFSRPQTVRLANGENIYFGNHSCAPSPYDLNSDGWDDLFIGEESGTVRYYHRSVFEDDSQLLNIPMSLSCL